MQYILGYDSVGDYSYDSTKIEIITSSARLVNLGGSYSTSDPLISLTIPFEATELLSAFSTTTEPIGTEVRYIIEVDGVKKYYFSTGWVSSDGSYAQANSMAVFNSNLPTVLDGTVLSSINIYLVMHSTGTDTPIVDVVSLSFNAIHPTVTPVHLTQVFGYCKDVNGTALENVTISITLGATSVSYGDQMLSPLKKVVTSSSTGYWTASLADTVSMTPNDISYEFKFNGQGYTNLSVYRKIPTVTSINFNSLTS